jgi:hypothetical protein
MHSAQDMSENTEDIAYRLRERARIRRQIPSRKSVAEGKPDRISDLLEEAAYTIDRLRMRIEYLEMQMGNNCGVGEDGDAIDKIRS